MKKTILAIMIIAIIGLSMKAMAANELLGFYADPNADANGIPYFMVVNAADGNVLYLKDDVNYVFHRWDGIIPDANFRITPVANRHSIGIYFADMKATVPACWYYAMLVTAHDGNEWLCNPVTPPLRYWDGSAAYIAPIKTFKSQDPNTLIWQESHRVKIYSPALTTQ